MPLEDFFEINFPYCLKKDYDGNWMCLNREYQPLGFHRKVTIQAPFDQECSDLPMKTKYMGLGEKTLTEVAYGSEGIRMNNAGEIVTVFLYHGATRPTKSKRSWDDYYSRLRKLASLQKVR